MATHGSAARRKANTSYIIRIAPSLSFQEAALFLKQQSIAVVILFRKVEIGAPGQRAIHDAPHGLFVAALCLRIVLLCHGFQQIPDSLFIGRSGVGGKSVVVEYVDGQMLVTQTRVVTNHYLADCEKQGVGSEQSHLRLDTLSACTGPADEKDVRDILESVAQKNYPQTENSYEKTMWSIVYCPEGRCADFYFAENYAHSYGLLLLEKGSFLKR